MRASMPSTGSSPSARRPPSPHLGARPRIRHPAASDRPPTSGAPQRSSGTVYCSTSRLQHLRGMEPRLTLEEQAEEREEEGGEEEEEEEYVFLDLDDVYEYTDTIPANVPYVLSGLNTLNPVLIIGDKLKLIGEYKETIGTCYAFSESKSETVLMHKETGPSEANLFEDISIIDPNQVPSRQVKPVASLHKILRFRLATDDEIQTATNSHNTTNEQISHTNN